MDTDMPELDAPACADAAMLQELVDRHAWLLSVDEPAEQGSGAWQDMPGTPAMWSYVARVFTR